MKIFDAFKRMLNKLKFLMNAEPPNSSLATLDSAGNPENFTPPPIEQSDQPSVPNQEPPTQ